METKKRSRLARMCLTGALLAMLAGSALAGSVSYLYDTLGRLAKATYSNGIVIIYSYDAAGNRSSTVVSGAP